MSTWTTSESSAIVSTTTPRRTPSKELKFLQTASTQQSEACRKMVAKWEMKRWQTLKTPTSQRRFRIITSTLMEISERITLLQEG
jgi:hypothetical protein